MRLEHGNLEQLKKEILAIFGTHVDVNSYSVFFFGSRVAGTGGDRSDIDIGIQGSAPIPDDAMAAIKEEIANIKTLYKIDVVDFHGVSPSFREVALKHVEYITQKKLI